MCTYVYIRLVIVFFPSLHPWDPLGQLQCGISRKSAAMPQCRGLVRTLMWGPYYFVDPRDDQAESRGNKCNESTYQENTQGGFLIVRKK